MLENVPLLGQPATVHEFNVMATLTCGCQPGNTPFLIHSAASGTTCVHCKKTYIIGKVMFERSTDPAKIHGTVGYILGS